MRPVGSTDRDNVAHIGRKALRERECDHATVGSTHDRVQFREEECSEQAVQDLGLVVGTDTREGRHTRFGSGGVAAASQEIEAENGKAIGIDRAARTDDGVPPAGRCAAGCSEHVPACGNPSQRRHDRCVGSHGSCQPPCDAHIFQFPAEMQREAAGQLENAFAVRNSFPGIACNAGFTTNGHETTALRMPLEKGGFHTSETPTEAVAAGRCLLPWPECLAACGRASTAPHLPAGHRLHGRLAAGVGTFSQGVGLRRLPRLQRA